MHEKALLRQRCIKQRASLSPAEVQSKSTAIASYVSTLAPFRVSMTLMMYMALPQEVQTFSLMQEAQQQRKRIVIPAVVAHELVAVEFPQESTQLHANVYGILEPDDLSARVDPAEIDCIVVPGVAFDRQGGRLGFGKGYYDRFLRQVPATTCLCGLAFAIQMVPVVPQMPHDISMHVVVTEQGLLPCRPVLPIRCEGPCTA